MAEFVSVPGIQTHERPSGSLAGAGPRRSTRPRIAQLEREARDREHQDDRGAASSSARSSRLQSRSSCWRSARLDLVGLFAVLVPLGVREWVKRKLARRRSQFAEQLPDTLQVISSALRSGHSFAGALAVVVETASEPMKSEMQRVVADEQLGVPLEQSLRSRRERMASRDLEQVGLVARASARGRRQLRRGRRPGGRDHSRALRAATAGRRRSRRRAGCRGGSCPRLPVGIVLISPGHQPALSPSAGRARPAGGSSLGFAAALCVAGRW